MPYSVGWGLQEGVFGRKCETAREALALAEEEIAAGRSDVIVTDLVTQEPVPIEALRERAEEEAGEEGARST
ncbi:MAG TPA: hypothetical protein VKU03_06465 [Roseiarcus sp.]|nr:hypothetical protein [Roseiarcus sp.]